MDEKALKQLRYDLEQPFPPETVKWRLGSTFQHGGKLRGLALAYIDARHVMDRLDSVVGNANWQSAIAETAAGRVLCTLAINVGGTWVSKTDGAGATQVEGDKGGISDALKRAAVQWGIGRYLYAMGDTYVDVEERGRTKVIVKTEYRRLARAIQAQFEGKFDQMKAALAVGNDEPDDIVPPKQVSAPSQPATPVEPAGAGAEQGDAEVEDVAATARARCEQWIAEIRDAGVLDDLKAVHAEMNKHRAVYAAMGPEFTAMFRDAIAALGKRKAAIEANDA